MNEVLDKLAREIAERDQEKFTKLPSSRQILDLHVPSPIVHNIVEAPVVQNQVNPTPVHVEPAQVIVDLSPIAHALQSLAVAVMALAKQKIDIQPIADAVAEIKALVDKPMCYRLTRPDGSETKIERIK